MRRLAHELPAVRYDAVLAMPFGRLGVRTDDGALVGLAFLSEEVDLQRPSGPVAERVCAQVRGYLQDPDFCFSLPLRLTGTAFQRRVWNAIAAIPRGGTRSYGDIASELGSAPRAVGQACGANPYPLVVPCHRVVAVGGMGGFAHAADGYLPRVKRWLLAHERAHFVPGQAINVVPQSSR